MPQSRKKSLIEAICNTVVGLIVSFILQVVLYPLLDIESTMDKNLIITLCFFVVSTLRSYVIRRLFAKTPRKLGNVPRTDKIPTAPKCTHKNKELITIYEDL